MPCEEVERVLARFRALLRELVQNADTSRQAPPKPRPRPKPKQAAIALPSVQRRLTPVPTSKMFS